jgi:hypothetical protein
VVIPKVGLSYKVDAVGTNDRETWIVTEVRENSRGDSEVLAKGSSTPYIRTFKPEQFKEIDKKMSKKIVSESVELVTTIAGAEMWVERIDYMPHHERRGRKPKGGETVG